MRSPSPVSSRSSTGAWRPVTSPRPSAAPARCASRCPTSSTRRPAPAAAGWGTSASRRHGRCPVASWRRPSSRPGPTAVLREAQLQVTGSIGGSAFQWPFVSRRRDHGPPADHRRRPRPRGAGRHAVRLPGRRLRRPERLPADLSRPVRRRAGRQGHRPDLARAGHQRPRARPGDRSARRRAPARRNRAGLRGRRRHGLCRLRVAGRQRGHRGLPRHLLRLVVHARLARHGDPRGHRPADRRRRRRVRRRQRRRQAGLLAFDAAGCGAATCDPIASVPLPSGGSLSLGNGRVYVAGAAAVTALAPAT